MPKNPLEMKFGFIPAPTELRSASQMKFGFPRPGTFWVCLAVLAKERNRLRIIMLVPVLDGLSKEQVVSFLSFTLVSVSNLCRIC